MCVILNAFFLDWRARNRSVSVASKVVFANKKKEQVLSSKEVTQLNVKERKGQQLQCNCNQKGKQLLSSTEVTQSTN